MSATEVLVKNLVQKNGKTRNSLMPVLQGIVQQEHFLTEEAMLCVIRVCKTITCHMKGKDDIINALCNVLKIKIGETTPDNKFTLLTANCLGWCHKGPVMLINDEINPELTPEKALEIIGAYSKGKH